MESVSLSIVSTEPTNFTVSVPTLIDIFTTSSPDSVTMFSQLSLSAMNSERDLIYGAHKVCDVAPNQPAAQFFRNYNRFDIQQLHNDVLVQDWSAIFNMPNPD
jgi:hypothetical protein